ncbi:MAG: CHAP domain-containing protein [Patescibacteria group bacterium]
MDSVRKILFGSAFAVLAASIFVISSPPKVQATLCPEFKDGSQGSSELAPNPNKVREIDPVKKACSGGGVIGFVTCKIAEFFASFSSDPGDPGKLDLRNSQMPEYLRAANQLALSGDKEALLNTDPSKREEPGAITGGIAKMLIPGYEQNDLDPIKQLTESEGQLVNGVIFLNQNSLQKNFTDTVYEEPNTSSDKGFYDLQIGTGEEAASNYQTAGKFGEIAPLYDRFGLLKQGLFPPAGEVAIPDLDQDCSTFDPSLIAVTGFVGESPHREVPWTAFGEIPDGDKEPSDVDCTKDEEGNVISCPSEVEGKTYEVGGNLDIQTEISLASEAWERIGAPSNAPGEGGVFNALLLPGSTFRTEDAKPQLKFGYDPHSQGTYQEVATLPVADLGNVGGATNCIVNGVTAHPAVANSEACTAAFEFFPGASITCTDEAAPLPFSNSAGSGIARKAWGIMNNMYQGFWCFWNWSKTDYPNIFDEDLFRRNPNPSREEVQNDSESLFWCTWLVWKTQSNHGPSLNSQAMKNYYQSGGRFVSAASATVQNVRPGYVVFFDVFNSINRLDHVGVVYSVTADSITFVQSNAVTKFDTITFNASGIGVQNLPWARVDGFGRP